MGEVVVIKDVILSGEDLNFTNSPWRAVRRSSNLRLLPIALGLLGSAFALSFMIDPSLVELIAVMGPLLLGWYAFIWVTNAVYLGSYKRTYAATPVGAGPCTFSFNEEGMKQELELGGGFYQWPAFVDVVETSAGFRFWMTPFMAIVLPSRFMSDAQRDALRQLVANARAAGKIKGVDS